MIQPGLIPLQPNLDFMDTFEPFQGEDMGREGMATCISFAQDKADSCFPFIGELLEWEREQGGLRICPALLSFLIVATKSVSFSGALLSWELVFSFSVSRTSGLALTVSSFPCRQQRAPVTRPPPHSFLQLKLGA